MQIRLIMLMVCSLLLPLWGCAAQSESLQHRVDALKKRGVEIHHGQVVRVFRF